MVWISDTGPSWKLGLTPFVGQPYHKFNSSSCLSSMKRLLVTDKKYTKKKKIAHAQKLNFKRL